MLFLLFKLSQIWPVGTLSSWFVSYWDIPISLKVLSYFLTIKDISHTISSPSTALGSAFSPKSTQDQIRCVPAPHWPRCSSQPAIHKMCHHALPQATTGMHTQPQLKLSVQALDRLVTGWEWGDQEVILRGDRRFQAFLSRHPATMLHPISLHLKAQIQKLLRIPRWQTKH